MASPVHSCRVCGAGRLEPVLSLGQMPPVNSFLSTPEQAAAEQRHPLAIALCPACSHVQLTHMLDPRDIFEDYIYFSSMSETVVRWGQTLAERYARELALSAGDLVGELASNDGCILKPFATRSRVLGIEPAKNIAEVANREGVPTRAEFFSRALGGELREAVGPARLILARNVVAHVPDVVGFVQGARAWLSEDGIFHVEVPYLREMVDKLEFDTIYHEHLSYFSVTALDRLFREGGLVLWDVEETPLHGGSLIARGRRTGMARPSVARYLQREREMGLTALPRLLQFARDTEALKTALPDFLHGLTRQGKRLAAYGAAAKGVVLTNYCGLGTDLLPFVADRSPFKQGKRMPGTHIPVVSPGQIQVERPDLLLVLAWNFFDEIARQQEAYRAAGGRFILPVPRPEIRGGPACP